MTFWTNLGLKKRLCSFRSVLERRAGKEIPESSKLEFLKKLLGNNFALSDAEGNNSGPLDKGGTANVHLLRKIIAIKVVKA